MKTLVGIDGQGHYPAALDLLGRLRFAENAPVLVHVEPPIVGPLAGSPVLYDVPVAMERAISAAGHALLEGAADMARGLGLGEGVETVYTVGSSSAELMRLAEERRADLVAIGSGRRGPLGSFFLGSVGRALAVHGGSSFLVARGERKEGPLRAVFATDHSEYANRCFARLLDMNPKGLERVTVVTATESSIDANSGDDDRTPYTLTEMENDLREKGETLVARLAASGRDAEFRLVEGFPAEAIRKAVEDVGADLLIVGARGHGLIERVLIGSFTLHAVVAEPYSVLVLRFPEA